MARYTSIASLIFTLALACAWPCSLAAQPGESRQSMGDTITIRIGDKVFAATLSDNATAAAFKKLLPLSVTMTELNGNEKLFRLPDSYARSSVNALFHTDRRLDAVRFQHAGPVLQVVSNYVQLHEIGRIDDPAGLEAAVGSGSVAVTFELRREKR